MNFEKLRALCLAMPGTDEAFPFDAQTWTARVGGKMFALSDIHEKPGGVNLKCEPTLAVLLREKYPAVRPGYHMNKTHWNTVSFDGTVPDEEITKMIEHSWEQVVKKLPRAVRATIRAEV